eukprot:6347421-Alexandrium_andersonii.AAC.1
MKPPLTMHGPIRGARWGIEADPPMTVWWCTPQVNRIARRTCTTYPWAQGITRRSRSTSAP